jgi:PAS domain S-box-containing protein
MNGNLAADSEGETHFRVSRQAEALLTLARRNLLSGADVRELFCQLTRLEARALGVERVSVWLFSPDGRTLEMESLYCASRDAYERGGRIHVADYPKYFEALAQEPMVAAQDAVRDPRTCELAGPYLQPLGIGAMLDVPVYVQGRLEGVLCHEHVGSPRPWAPDERIFAAAMGNIVAMAIAQARCGRALREAEEARERYRRLVQCSTDALLVHDLEGRIREANEAACLLLGLRREELLGTSVGAFDVGYDPVQSPRLWNGLRAGEPVAQETVYRRQDGSVRHVETRLGRVEMDGQSFVLCVARDVTERRRLEDGFRQVQRMEALRRLAGGVAHDFNNLLTAISGYARMLTEGLAEPSARGYAEEILKASEQAATVTRQLLAFSQRQVMAPRKLELNRLIRETEPLLRPLVPENVRLEISPGEGVPPVMADVAQLQQVLVNLTLWAREEVAPNGTVTIETHGVRLRRPEPAHAAEIPPGEYAVLSVCDTGRGISAEERGKLFEPCGGTEGVASSLALPTVYGIARQSGGYVRALSHPGEGTRLDVFLPAAREAAESGSGATAGAPSGRELILLAEDSDTVRGLIREVLRSRGYRVLEAPNGREGLDLFRRNGPEVDLVVTDVVMPDIGGVEMVREIRALAPRVPVLFLSAYPGDTVEAGRLLEFPQAWFLAKPFSPVEFLAEVGRILSTCPRALQE